MKSRWTQPQPDYHGGRFAFANLEFSPRPLRKPHPPLLIGGSSEAAIARTARSGDGWHPSGISPAAYARGCARVRALAGAAGRDAHGIERSLRLDFDTSQHLDDARLDALTAELEAYRAAGCSHALLALNSNDVPQLETWMTAIAGRVLPAMR
jgi:alkanesulfonate monooxygenase SsuD/methylene tetrahydromethanopterin reductase-like flavin-dependent oxidoreductase (luciferase family)